MQRVANPRQLAPAILLALLVALTAWMLVAASFAGASQSAPNRPAYFCPPAC